MPFFLYQISQDFLTAFKFNPGVTCIGSNGLSFCLVKEGKYLVLWISVTFGAPLTNDVFFVISGSKNGSISFFWK